MLGKFKEALKDLKTVSGWVVSTTAILYRVQLVKK